jgi:hypothetical protein
MNKRYLITSVVAVVATLFVVAGIYAGTQVKDEVNMENKAYAEHTKSIVMFSHLKHTKEYAEQNPGLYKAGCGECHHDKDNKPLTNLKAGDDVKNCIECHKKPGYMTGKDAKGLSKEQKREYHANAIHDNCKGCHKTFNKSKKLKSKDAGAAPTSCKQCHPKEKK